MQLRTTMILALATASLTTAALAQQSGDYQGVSKPPTDAIEASPEAAPVIRKPAAGVLADSNTTTSVTSQSYSSQSTTQSAIQSDSTQYSPRPSSAGPVADPDSGPIAPPAGQEVQATSPSLNRRYNPANDPDGDIVHPRAARPGELTEGTSIRVKLLDRLSSRESEQGEAFRGQVAYDVLQDGRVLIPAGSSIEGKVTSVSSGHFGGHGSLRLRPDTITLPDGNRYRLHAETTGTIGSHTRIGSEGSINPGSRAKRDGIEYGAVAGTGVVAGAIVAGPVGALTGGLIGAGIVTTHLMVNHAQTTLEPGSILQFTLTEPMDLTAAN